MKTIKTSLILYFVACALVVFFRITEGNGVYVLYVKSLIIPLLFVYYLEENNFRIEWIKAAIFLFCFIGDVSVLLDFTDTIFGSLLSFLIVYLLLLKLAIDDFRTLKFTMKDGIPMLIVLFFLLFVLVSVLSLKLENLKLDFFLFVIYGVSILLLSFVSSVNYYKKTNFAFMNLFLMCTCFIISDVFYVVYKFYLDLDIFGIVTIVTQIAAFFFMVCYFIARSRYRQNIMRRLD